MARDYENTIFPGNLRNRINRITMNTGVAKVHYNDGRSGQNNGTYDPRSVISRTTQEPPVERNLQNGVKDKDV